MRSKPGIVLRQRLEAKSLCRSEPVFSVCLSFLSVVKEKQLKIPAAEQYLCQWWGPEVFLCGMPLLGAGGGSGGCRQVTAGCWRGVWCCRQVTAGLGDMPLILGQCSSAGWTSLLCPLTLHLSWALWGTVILKGCLRGCSCVTPNGPGHF